MAPKAEQRAVLLGRHGLQRHYVLKRPHLVASAHEHLGLLGHASQPHELAHQRLEVAARFLAFHEDGVLGAFDELGAQLLEELAALVRLGFPDQVRLDRDQAEVERLLLRLPADLAGLLLVGFLGALAKLAFLLLLTHI